MVDTLTLLYMQISSFVSERIYQIHDKSSDVQNGQPMLLFHSYDPIDERPPSDPTQLDRITNLVDFRATIRKHFSKARPHILFSAP